MEIIMLNPLEHKIRVMNKQIKIVGKLRGENLFLLTFWH